MIYVSILLSTFVVGLWLLGYSSKHFKLSGLLFSVLVLFLLGKLLSLCNYPITLGLAGVMQLLVTCGVVLAVVSSVRGLFKSAAEKKIAAQATQVREQVAGKVCQTCGEKIILDSEGVVTKDGVYCHGCLPSPSRRECLPSAS